MEGTSSCTVFHNSWVVMKPVLDFIDPRLTPELLAGLHDVLKAKLGEDELENTASGFKTTKNSFILPDINSVQYISFNLFLAQRHPQDVKQNVPNFPGGCLQGTYLSRPGACL